MKSKWEKLKEFYNSRFGKPLIFFGVYFIFFAIVFSLGSSTSTIDNRKSISENMWDEITNNYEYLYTIHEKDSSIISLQGKRYNNKNYFTKKTDDILKDEIYIFYENVEIKRDNVWLSDDDYVIVSDSFDHRLLDIDYLKMLITDAELMKSETNFDDSISDFYKYGITDIEVVSMDNALKQIIILNPLYSLDFQYKNINGVKDFVVEN